MRFSFLLGPDFLAPVEFRHEAVGACLTAVGLYFVDDALEDGEGGVDFGGHQKGVIGKAYVPTLSAMQVMQVENRADRLCEAISSSNRCRSLSLF